MSDVAAGIYCRISLAKMGDTTKTDDQERICRDLATRLDWPVVKVYTDQSKSAWQKNRKRKDWDQMLADVDSGVISALIVYHGDRLIRQPYDLEKLLSLADGKGIRLAAPTGTRNLDSAEDRFVLRIEAAMACRESDNLSRRRKNQYARWTREGRVRPGGTGGRPYAFETDGLTVRDDEADLLRKMAAKILAGDTTGSVVSWLNGQGTAHVTGKPFTLIAVRRLLTHARYAGLMPDGITPAAWPAILNRDDWETLRAILGARQARASTGPARYLLSGLATCGNCGHTLQAHRSGSPRPGVAYACRHCWKVFRSMPLLDGYVGRRVWRRLNHPGNPDPAMAQLPGLAAEYDTLTRARAELTALIDDPDQPYPELLTGRLRRLDERIARLRDQTADSARQRLIRQHQGITWGQWEALPLPVRRALVAAYFTVEVLPATRKGPGFRTGDVRLTPI